jgi:hypothetical protein
VVLAIVSPGPFFRYLAPLIPVLIILVALLVVLAARVYFVVSIVIIALLVLISPMIDFIYEITHDYDGPIEGIVKYLNENGSKEDVVAITYGDMPLKFYTQMRIVGGLTGEDLSQAMHAKWVILRKHIICEKDANVRRYLVQNLPLQSYERVIIDYPDIPFENRESLPEHLYRTDTSKKKVVILKRAD